MMRQEDPLRQWVDQIGGQGAPLFEATLTWEEVAGLLRGLDLLDRGFEVASRIGIKPGVFPLDRIRESVRREVGNLTSPLPQRCVAAVLLGTADRERAAEYLGDMAEAQGEHRCLVAAIGLGWIGDGRGVAALAEALADEDAGLRRTAAMALGRSGIQASSALVTLRERWERDPDREVRRACRGAIRRIERALRDGPAELIAGSALAGSGTELEASSAPDSPSPRA
ncbi:MAG: HEAT repeat domain-containing protein [Armatimonadetes bacterium]|nr:HEAT repeat domain-containing protein [Armatimonadota bacterium]